MTIFAVCSGLRFVTFTIGTEFAIQVLTKERNIFYFIISLLNNNYISYYQSEQ